MTDREGCREGGGARRPDELADELADEAERCLREHVASLADRARSRYGAPSADRIEELLGDPECVRVPHRLVFGTGGRAANQFAQPGPDPHGSGRALWVHPALRDRPDLLPLAVAYLVPVINYGEDLVGDELCLGYVARLFGWPPPESYRRVCALADALELEVARGSEAGPPR